MIIEEKYKIENTNNQEEDKKDGEGEWEEVKKGGKRMKQVNTISNFKTSVLGTVFEGIIKQDIQEKGNSLSKCQIEPFFVLSLNLDGSSVDGDCHLKYHQSPVPDCHKGSPRLLCSQG